MRLLDSVERRIVRNLALLGLLLLGMALIVASTSCSLRGVHRLPEQQNTAFADTLEDCIKRKLDEQAPPGIGEDHALPRVRESREQRKAAEAECRKEGVR